MKYITQIKKVPVVGSYDVVVCGGGPSGIIAAIAAARGGAKTAIIERYGFFGGMATAALVAPISVFNYNGRRIIGGIPWEFVQRMIDIGGAEEEKPLGNISFSPEKYKLIAQRMLLEAGVTIYFHSYISGCQQFDNRITSVTFENKEGTQAVDGKLFIDCTGDADLSEMAGVPMQPFSKHLQPASLIFMLGGVDTDSLPMLRHSQQGVNYLDTTIREKLSALREHQNIPLFGGPWYCGIMSKGVVLVNITRIQVNITVNQDASDAECELREQANLFAKLLKDNVPAFSDSSLLCTAAQAGARETRRIKGAHLLTGEEYLGLVRFPDTVSRGCHPVDIHSADSTKQRCEFLKDAGFVPYRSLIAENFPNLLVAGRTISADSVASASLRVQASCMGLGQAAGAASALCVRDGCDVQSIDVDELRSVLIGYGANLDN